MNLSQLKCVSNLGKWAYLPPYRELDYKIGNLEHGFPTRTRSC